MTNEMLTRVAKAIYEGRNGAGAKAWASQPQSHRAPYLLDARAAIEAMRGPTLEMLGDGYVAHYYAMSGDKRLIEGKIYAAMIGAALQPDAGEK